MKLRTERRPTPPPGHLKTNRLPGNALPNSLDKSCASLGPLSTLGCGENVPILKDVAGNWIKFAFSRQPHHQREKSSLAEIVQLQVQQSAHVFGRGWHVALVQGLQQVVQALF